jgi:hypothetical protein
VHRGGLHDPLRSPDKPTPYLGDGLVNIHPSAQAIVDRSAKPVVEGELRVALRVGGVLQAEVGRNLFQQSVQFGAFGGVQSGDGALFQRFPGGFDVRTKGAAAFCCLDEHGASVGGVGGPGDVAGAL